MAICPPDNATFVCTQIYVTVAPNAFDLHYWIFSLAVMFGITALMLGFASKLGVQIGSHVFVFLTLLGLLTGSLVDLMLNIIGWGFVVMITLGFGVYIWRARG